MKEKKFFRKFASVALAAATVFSIAAVPAAAATGEATSLPDTTSARSLTIYKYDNLETDADKGEGLFDEVNTTEHRPMKNVIFDVYYYADLDSDVPESISEEDATAWVNGNSKALRATLVTDSTGSATWNAATGKDADGVYLVVERENRAIQYTAEAVPFFISLPYTDPEGDGWIYDVVVQPKNELVPGPTITKDVTTESFDDITMKDSDLVESTFDDDDETGQYSETLTWIIRTTIPADLYYTDSVDNEVVEFYADNFRITDEIDTQLTYMGNIRAEIFNTKTEDKTVLDNGHDFDTTGTTAVVGQPGGTLVISLTDFGMKTIMSQVGTDWDDWQIYIYFDFYINESAVVGDPIYNDAELEYTNSTGLDYDPVYAHDGLDIDTDGDGIPDNSSDGSEHLPEVHIGGVVIEKVDIANTNTKLAGAEFHIANSEENALAGEFMTEVNGSEIKIVTDENGIGSYAGLPFDNLSTDPEGGTYYWLVETQAPDGYQLLSTPIQVAVNADTYRTTTVPYEITNSTKYDLPRAGGNGINTYLLIGLCVMAGIAAVSVVGVRKFRKA